MAQAKLLVRGNRHGCSLVEHVLIQAGRNVVVDVAGHNALVVAEYAGGALNFNRWQGNRARTVVHNRDRKLSSGHKLLNDGNIAVNVGVDHGPR